MKALGIKLVDRRLLAGPSLLAIAIASTNSLATEVEEVKVWGTQVKTSSLIVGESDLEIKQADHISDLLRVIPGVDVGGAHSLNQRITIRSMDDKDLRISIDGANQNTYMYHHMGNLQIHADILQAVDIEVGTNSVLNGGLGGAVRFETKEAKDLLAEGESFGGRVQATYGNNSGTNISAVGYGQLSDSIDLLIYYNDVSRSDYKVGGGVIEGADGEMVEGTDGKVRGLEGDVSDTLIKLGWDISDTQRLKVGYETYNDKGDYSYRPDMGLATDLAITNSLMVPLLWPTKFTRDTLTINYDRAIGDHTDLNLAIFKNESQLYRDERGWAENDAFAAWAAMVTGDADNTGLNVLAESNFSSHTLSYGAEWIKYETAYDAVYESITDSSSEQQKTQSLFVQDRIELGDKFTIIPGLRYDYHDLDATLVSDVFSKVSTALAAEFAPGSTTLIKLSTTELFKAPEIAEVFVGAGLFDDANPDIKAEEGRNTEFSFAYKDDVLGADSLTAGFTLFQTDIDNYIYDYAPGKDNVGDMVIEGGELYVGYDIKAFSALLTFASAESELAAFSEYSDLDGARIDRQQGDSISLSFDYELESMNLNLHWDSIIVEDVEAGLDIDGATLDNAKDGYAVHNISAHWESKFGLAVTAGVDNLFDEFYASQSSRTGTSFHPRFGSLYLTDYEPGRNAKVTIAFTF